MLEKIAVMAGLTLALGAACDSDRDVTVIDDHAAGIPVSAISDHALLDDSAPNDAGAPEHTSDSPDAGGDAEPHQRLPPRDVYRPSNWSEIVAGVCLGDDNLCPEGKCPAFSDVLAEIRLDGRVIWAGRDYCVAEDGEPFIMLGYLTGVSAVFYVFRAGSGEIVSAAYLSDGPSFCWDTAPTDYMVAGRFIPDCLSIRESVVPCTDEAAPDLGSFESCYYYSELTPP